MKIYNYFKNMSQEFRLKNIDKAKSCSLEEIKQNELMSRKQKQISTTLNYIKHFLILSSTFTRCILIHAFAILLGIARGITSYTIELKSVQ